MTSGWGNLFGRARDAFRDAKAPRDPEDGVAELLGAMRRELHAARTALRDLEPSIDRARANLERERTEQATCERRRVQAERIGDAETARLAAEWGAKHAERAAVAEGKVRALQGERDLLRSEADAMARAYRDADRNRWQLVARLRERGSIDAADAFSELHRTDAPLEDRAARGAAMDEVDEMLGHSDRAGDAAARAERERRADAKLDELKRRMGAK